MCGKAKEGVGNVQGHDTSLTTLATNGHLWPISSLSLHSSLALAFPRPSNSFSVCTCCLALPWVVSGVCHLLTGSLMLALWSENLSSGISASTALENLPVEMCGLASSILQQGQSFYSVHPHTVVQVWYWLRKARICERMQCDNSKDEGNVGI